MSDHSNSASGTPSAVPAPESPGTEVRHTLLSVRRLDMSRGSKRTSDMAGITRRARAASVDDGGTGRIHENSRSPRRVGTK